MLDGEDLVLTPYFQPRGESDLSYIDAIFNFEGETKTPARKACSAFEVHA